MKRRLWVSAGIAFGCLSTFAGHASAEVTLVKPADGWEVYTTGRVGAFVQYLNGQGVPRANDPNHQITAEGINVAGAPVDGIANDTSGKVSSSRVRSGFLGNILTVGVRRQLTPNTSLMGQISLWSTAETNAQRTYEKGVTDAREGYLKLEGPGGSLLVGRALSLFGRGATRTNFLYGHGYGVGAPTGFSDSGPSGGHIGFGVIAAVFVAGVAYATPVFGGLQLTVGYYDPAVQVGLQYSRTKLGRPEAEATYDLQLGPKQKLHVFADGAFQKLYDTNGTDQSKNVWGVAGGARLELGMFNVGIAAHTGKGVGVNFFLNQSPSINNQATANLRPFDGAYIQTQTMLGKFDINVGAGITRAHQMSDDLDPTYPNQPSYLKSQMGISGVLVYHFAPYLHGAFDYFRSDVRWWYGERQVINAFNLGMTATW